MQNFKDLLEQLNEQYQQQPFDEAAYATLLEKAQRTVSLALPGLTIIWAENQERDYPLSVTHALVPERTHREDPI